MRNIKKPLLLFLLCLAFFMVILDASVVNVALPSIREGLSASISDLQWVIAGYILTLSGLLLLAGYFSDHLGAKKTFLIGLVFFLLASLACGLSKNIYLLIFFRIIQGAFAAAVVPSTLALISASYHDARERASAIGVWGSMGGIAAASGPVIGAVLTARFGWPAVFLINVPIALLVIPLAYKLLAETPHVGHKKFDFFGLIFGVSFVASLAVILIELGRHSFSSPVVFIPAIIFIISLVLFIWIENRFEQPIFPLKFFKNSNFSMAMIVGAMINFGLYGALFMLPLYFHEVRHYSVLQTGLAVLPLLILVAVASYFSASVASRKGPTLPIKIGFIIGSLAFFSLIPVAYFEISYWLMLLSLAAAGFGMAFIMPAATIVAIQAVPRERSGAASSAFTTCRQLGSLVGVALLGTILATTGNFIVGMNISLALSGFLFLVGFVIAFIISAPDQ